MKSTKHIMKGRRNLNDLCDGCSLIDKEYYPACHIFNIRGIPEKCPCVKCVVKASCSTMCSERAALYKQIEYAYEVEINKAKWRYIDTKRRSYQL